MLALFFFLTNRVGSDGIAVFNIGAASDVLVVNTLELDENFQRHIYRTNTGPFAAPKTRTFAGSRLPATLTRTFTWQTAALRAGLNLLWDYIFFGNSNIARELAHALNRRHDN